MIILQKTALNIRIGWRFNRSVVHV